MIFWEAFSVFLLFLETRDLIVVHRAGMETILSKKFLKFAKIDLWVAFFVLLATP